MPTVLVTGMSGTGKSTVLAELRARGFEVVDTDDDGWAIEVPLADGSGIEQLWDEDRMGALLASVAAPLIVSGCASNQGRFYDRFDAVILLSVPADVLVDRVMSRSTNRFGKDPAELARILADMESVEPRLRATSTVEIVTTAPVSEVADRIASYARG